jgi:hypothetical protein
MTESCTIHPELRAVIDEARAKVLCPPDASDALVVAILLSAWEQISDDYADADEKLQFLEAQVEDIQNRLWDIQHGR